MARASTRSTRSISPGAAGRISPVTFLENHLFFGGDQNLHDAVLHVQALDTQLQVFFDQVFLTRVGVYYIPPGVILFVNLGVVFSNHISNPNARLFRWHKRKTANRELPDHLKNKPGK